MVTSIIDRPIVLLEALPLSDSRTVKIYSCRNCNSNFIPKNVRHILSGKIKEKEPKTCTICHSSWWKIYPADRVQCLRCGYKIDVSKFRSKIKPEKCPNCHQRKYTIKDFEKFANLNKEIRKKLRDEIKARQPVYKEKKFKMVEKLEKPKFVKSIIEKKEKFIDQFQF